MQRLLRIENIVLSSEFEKDLRSEIDLLRRHLPPSIYQMYATPHLVIEGTSIHLDWLSHVLGTITPYNKLSLREQIPFNEELKRAQHTLRAFYAELVKRNRSADAAKLSALLVEPQTEQLYIVNNKLIIAQWKTPPLSEEAAFKQHYAKVAHLIPPPEFALIIDTSYSMRLHVGASLEDERWFYDIQHTEEEFSKRGQNIFKSPSRLAIAKEAAQNLLPHLHPRIAIRFMCFDGAGEPQDNGLFTVEQRGALKDRIQQLEVSGTTPLVATLFQAANAMDGVNNDALILCFIDGQDCSGINLYEVTHYFKTYKPRLRINLVDISGQGLSDGLAQETGGRVYNSKDPKQISKDILHSTNEIAKKPKRRV